MLDFYAKDFVAWSRSLVHLEKLLGTYDWAIEPKPADPQVEELVRVGLAAFLRECERLPFSRSLYEQIKRLFGAVEGISGDKIKRERFLAVFNEVRTNSDIELSDHRFYVVPQADAPMMSDTPQFGEGVATQIPDAAVDIRSAGQCLALNQYTGSVFHCMRAAEHGLRALARHLRIKVSDKGQRCRIEDADWNKVVTACKNKIETARRYAASAKKKARLQRFSDLADRSEYVRDIWRNDLSHAGKGYDEIDARSVFSRTKLFMEGVAAALAG